MPQQTIFIVEAKTVCLPRVVGVQSVLASIYVVCLREVQSPSLSLSHSSREAVPTASFVATFITHTSVLGLAFDYLCHMTA